MPNQYSITLSDESAGILKRLNEQGWKTSHAIDAAIMMTAYDGWDMLELPTMVKVIRNRVGLN
jgi:hypothetical protein